MAGECVEHEKLLEEARGSPEKSLNQTRITLLEMSRNDQQQVIVEGKEESAALISDDEFNADERLIKGKSISDEVDKKIDLNEQDKVDGKMKEKGIKRVQKSLSYGDNSPTEAKSSRIKVKHSLSVNPTALKIAKASKAMKIAVFLKEGAGHLLHLESGRQTNAWEIKRMMIKNLALPDEADNVFALWLISPLLELQLKDQHIPYQLRQQWRGLLARYTIAKNEEIEKDEPVMVFQRNSFLSVVEERKIRDDRIIKRLFEEAKVNILKGRYRVEASDAEKLGAYLARIEHGRFNREEHKAGFFKKSLPSFLPQSAIRKPWLSKVSFNRSISSEHHLLTQFELASERAVDVKEFYKLFLEFCWTLPFYGAAFFKGQVEQQSHDKYPWKALTMNVAIAIGREGVTIFKEHKTEMLLQLSFDELSWDYSASDDVDSFCIEYDSIEHDNKRVAKQLQIFSPQAAMMDALVDSCVEEMNRLNMPKSPTSPVFSDEPLADQVNYAAYLCTTSTIMANKMMLCVFVILVLDLIAFTVILPLLPSILDNYEAKIKNQNESKLMSTTYELMNWVKDVLRIPNNKRYNNVLIGGILGSLFSLLQFISNPLFGALSDVIGRKKTMIISMCGTVLSYYIWMKSTSFEIFLLSRIIGGFWKGSVTIATTIMTDITSKENRAKGMALIGIAFGVGFTVGPLLGVYYTNSQQKHDIVPYYGAALLSTIYATRLIEPCFNCTQAITFSSKKMKESDTAMETTVKHAFKDGEYLLSMEIEDERFLHIEIENEDNGNKWRGKFDSQYVEELTHKTGNFKQFNIFCSMLESALRKTSESVMLDLMTYADLESLRSQKSNGTSNYQHRKANSSQLNNKRYLIMTYTVEFDRIHYPLSLQFIGQSDTISLRKKIKDQHDEIKQLKFQLSRMKLPKHQKAEKDEEFEQLLNEKEELQTELEMCKGMLTKTGVAKELRILKKVIQSLETDLLKERSRYKRMHFKKTEECQKLSQELEEIKANERNLKVRCRNLTEELAMFKRASTQSPMYGHRWKRKDLGKRSPSQERGARNSSFRNKTPSPSGNSRFNPTAYVEEKKRRENEAKLARGRTMYSNPRNTSGRRSRSGSYQRSTPDSISNRIQRPSSVKTSSTSKELRGRKLKRTSSVGSYGSRHSSVDSRSERRRYISPSPVRAKSQGSLSKKSSSKKKNIRNVYSSAGSEIDDVEQPSWKPVRRVSSKNSRRKINRTNHGREKEEDDDDYVDDEGNKSLDIANIDARLNALQKFMKANLNEM
eukprot:gene20309-22306_t